MTHVTPTEIEEFILGHTLGDPQAFRRHVSICPSCAARLAREAEMDVLLREAALERAAGAAVHEPAPSRAAWHVAAGIAAALLLLAIAVWWAARPLGDRSAGRDLAVLQGPERHGARSDPRAGMPGFGVLTPQDLCLWVTEEDAVHR